ncbi:MAG TPA: class II aldolase/adducin family protein [Bacteroidales bacterium]|nr:class II aldolase/adducin family protein [Bacteroidales bacterium]HPS16384.1 class II aldolase/adducin family protein [Bacteroidales bacterium]
MAEEYSGIKFKTILKDAEPPMDSHLEELSYWCKIFHEKKLAPPYPGGSYGNLSFRIKSGENDFIITGTCIGFKNELKNDCFVKVTDCDMEDRIVYAEGKRYPSSESMLHYSIYKARPEVNAIFHGHSKEILDNVKTLGIPETAKEESYGTIELVNSVLDILDNHDFLCMKNHGFISLGKSMKEAGEQLLKII